MEQDSKLFLERRISLLYGAESAAMRAFDLVQKELCAKKGFAHLDGSDCCFDCIEVATLLISYGVTNQNAVTAALLHDMAENVPDYSVKFISKHFGESVAEMVRLVSKKQDLDYMDENVLKEYLEDISKDVHSAAIITAEKINTLCTLRYIKPFKRYKKALDTEQYLPFFKLCWEIYPQYESLFYAAKTQILPHINEIKAHYHDYCELEKLKDNVFN